MNNFAQIFDMASYVAMVSGVVGVIANLQKKWWCFVIWTFSNLFWVCYDLYKGIYSQTILMTVYLVLAIWGWHKWYKEDKNREDEKKTAHHG